MTSGGEVEFYSSLPIVEALALIPSELSKRLKGEYRIIDVHAEATMRELGGRVTLWAVTVEYEDV